MTKPLNATYSTPAAASPEVAAFFLPKSKKIAIMYLILINVGRATARYYHRKDYPMAEDKSAEITEKIAEMEAGAEIEATLNSDAPAEEEKFAKSGKKSKKHIEEVKAEAERQARKAENKAAEEAGEKPKGATPVTRPKIERRGKNYQAAAKQIEAGKLYSLKEALELAAKTNHTKFDATVEAHVRLGVDPRQADQNIRATVVLPHGNGKTALIQYSGSGGGDHSDAPMDRLTTIPQSW